MSPAAERVPLERPWFEAPCAWLACAAPLLVTALRASVAPQWRDDLAIVRALGFIPFGGEGLPSALLTQVLSLVPIGGRLQRAALVGALGVALTSAAVYRLARRLLEARDGDPTGAPLLALAAAWIAALCHSVQLEGTVAGGASLAAGLALWAIAARPRDIADARLWAAYGGLVAVVLSESVVAGVTLLVALLSQLFVAPTLPRTRELLHGLVGLAGAYALCLLPALLRPLSGRTWMDLGTHLFAGDLAATDVVARHPGAFAAWVGDVGPILGGLAVLGVILALADRRTRFLALPLCVFVVADFLVPASRLSLLAADPRAPLRLAAVAALAVGASVGIQATVGLLSRSAHPLLRRARHAVLAATFALVLVAAEDSAVVGDRRAHRGAEAWTDEALGALPPNAVLLVGSREVAWRLWAALTVRGERPDLLVVPLPLLSHGTMARTLLRREPGLAPLIREMAIHGRPNEYALSALADRRPVYLELMAGWDRRLLDHLVPEPLWLRFSAHPVGRSDRIEALSRGRAAFQRVLAQSRRGADGELELLDEATLDVLDRRGREQAVTLLSLGDWKLAGEVIDDLREISPTDPHVDVLEAIAQAKRRRFDTTALLRRAAR